MSEYIYVIGVDGDPQMPTKRKRHVEQLLQTMNKNDSVSSLMNEEYSYKEDNSNIDISKAKISYAA